MDGRVRSCLCRGQCNSPGLGHRFARRPVSLHPLRLWRALFLPMLPGLLRQGLPAGALPLLAWRGVVHTAAVVFWFFAMARIPLAHVTAIGYLSPVILLLAGALLLGEGLTWRRMLAVGFALIGTLIVLRPGLEPVGIGHLGQMAAATCFAGSYLYAKKLSGFVSASVVVAMVMVVQMRDASKRYGQSILPTRRQ